MLIMQWMFTHNLRLHPMEGECLYDTVIDTDQFKQTNRGE
jgi:hypothetical protein